MNEIMVIVSIVAGVVVLFVSLSMFVVKNYIKVPPNMAAIVFGRKHKIQGSEETSGFKIIQGGGFFKIPFLENVEFMDLSLRQINISVENAPNKDGVMTTVEGIANVKFASQLGLLRIAVERFLSQSNQEVDKVIFQNLEGHLRSTVGQMSMEDLINNKQALNEAILSDANDDFEKIGIKIDFLNITDISDNDDYLVNMGRKKAAQIKRDAEIGEADALKTTVMETSTAQREGVERKNQNLALISESDKEKDVVAAKMKAVTDKEKAIADQAGPKAHAEALRGVVEAQAGTEAAQEKANIVVEEQRALKVEKQLYAEKIVPAEATKQAQIVAAQGVKESTIINADGEKQATIKEAEGHAESIKVKAFATAEGEAAKIRQLGEADGNAIKARLVGEAEGIEAKAIAYEKLDATGKFLEVLNALQTLGPNMIKEFAGVMSASTQHLANVDEIKIVDFGGNGSGSGSVANFGKVPTEILAKFGESAKATGFDISSLLNMMGVSSDDIKKAISATMTTSPDEIKSDKKSA